MADFCKQCSIDIFGEDSKDFAGLLADWEDGPTDALLQVLCEGCGVTCVDNTSTCMVDCLEHHCKREK